MDNKNQNTKTQAQAITLEVTLSPYLYQTESGSDKEALFDAHGTWDNNPNGEDRSKQVEKIAEGMKAHPIWIDFANFTKEDVIYSVKRELQRRLNDRTQPKLKPPKKGGVEAQEDGRALRHKWARGEIETYDAHSLYVVRQRMTKEPTMADAQGALMAAAQRGDVEALRRAQEMIQTLLEQAEDANK